MEELAKALAEAIRTGTQLAWPALLLYMATKALGPISLGVTAFGRANWDAEYKHNEMMARLRRNAS